MSETTKTAITAPQPTTANAAPPPRRGPRIVGNPLAGIPQDVLSKLSRAVRQPLPGAPVEAGTGGVWGTNDAGIDQVYGTILSASIKRSAEKEKYPDNNGETKAVIFYDPKWGGSFECLIAGTLEPGDAVTVGGHTMLVDDAEKQWEYKGWSKYRVNAEKHDGVTL